MYSSIATVGLSGTLEEKITAIAQAGFAGVELFENDLTVFPGSARQAGELIRAHGLTLVTLQPFRDLEGLTGTARQQAFDRAEQKFDLMAELGTDLLMCCSTLHPDALPGLDRAAADYAELGERAARRGMRVAFEALAWGKHIHDYRDSWEVVRRANHPAVGLVLDTFHIFSRQTELTSMANIPGERIFLVQTADAPRLSMDHLSWSRHYRCFPGQGELNLDEFMQRLVATTYQGPLSHEIFNDVFRMGHSAQTARDGLRSYHLLCSMAQPETVPAAQPIDGVAFVEINIRPERAEVLRQDLRALGLSCVGRHRTLSAERWAVNQLNIVVNMEADFAGRPAGRQHTHVGAFGVLVEHAEDAVKRAAALGFDLLKPKAVGATHGMTALRNADGSLGYIVDATQLAQVWAQEFVALEAVPEGPLVEVDHLSLSMNYHDYLSLMLQYRAVFDVVPSASFDVTDPRGLIQSQVLQNRQHPGPFRLALNASMSPDTSSNRFLHTVGGSSVQHIALRTTDMATTVAALDAAEVPCLSIPQNYYRDVQARFGLNPAVTEWMRSHDVLYDADEGGEFHQRYIRPEQQSFFFEVVQRDGYLGLGAPNAFVRAAAQQQALELSTAGGNAT